jgi:hypothetical protein
MMTKKFLVYVIFIYFSKELLFGMEYEELYQNLSNLYAPTKEDFHLIQSYLNKAPREYLTWLNTFYPEYARDELRYDLRARTIQLLPPKGAFDLSLQELFFTPKEEKESCVISFASWNQIGGYRENLLAMGGHLERVKFQGHFLYRLGGWPNIEGGSLSLVHVPYAFKVCMFKEAERLGYKKILWLDTSCVPLRNFDEIFQKIEKEGYFLLKGGDSCFKEKSSEKIRLYFSFTQEEHKSITPLSLAIIGLDLENPIGKELLDLWYKAAEDLDPYLSPRPEQNALAAIAYRLQLLPSASFYDIFCTHQNPKIAPSHYFFLGYRGTETLLRDLLRK